MEQNSMASGLLILVRSVSLGEIQRTGQAVYVRITNLNKFLVWDGFWYRVFHGDKLDVYSRIIIKINNNNKKKDRQVEIILTR